MINVGKHTSPMNPKWEIESRRVDRKSIDQPKKLLKCLHRLATQNLTETPQPPN